MWARCPVESTPMSDKPFDDDQVTVPLPEAAQDTAAPAQPQPPPGVSSSPATTSAASAAPAARARGGWGGPVLGGVIAAGLGFGLAQYLPLTAAGPGVTADELATVRADLDGLKAEIAAAPGADPSVLTQRLDALEVQVAAITLPDLAPLEGRIAALEARPVGSLSGADAAALATLQSQVAALKAGGISQTEVDAANAALQAKLDEALAAATAMQASAAETATRSAERAALLQISAALDSGAPFGSAIKALQGAALPEVLTANAGGIPSLKSLQDGFPQAARLALDAALKTQMGSGWTERVTSFLRTQVGARSLTPKEGSDPDAVLSRAEAALTAGDVGGALAELDTLPEVAKSAIAGWRVGADLRQQALAALTSLMQERGL